MNCADRELQIALYAAGDLPAGEITELEQHLATCADCRCSMGVYAANCAALADAAVDLDEIAAAAVRHRVMSELRSVRAPRFSAWFAAAAILLITIAVAGRWSAVPDAAILTYTPPVPSVAAVVDPHAHATVARHRVGNVIAAVAQQPQAPVLVKLETEDPNIVIYWVAD